MGEIHDGRNGRPLPRKRGEETIGQGAHGAPATSHISMRRCCVRSHATHRGVPDGTVNGTGHPAVRREGNMNDSEIANLVVDDRSGGVFRVNRKAFTDPAVFEIEKKRVFDSTWLYVGHESEVAKRGDYITRKVGGRPVIFVRDDRNQVRVFFNTCPHRGNAICREHSGNGKSFQCFYHAWTFNTRGELVGLPGADGYGPGFDRKTMGMVPPARVDSYRGLVFLSFNP